MIMEKAQILYIDFFNRQVLYLKAQDRLAVNMNEIIQHCYEIYYLKIGIYKNTFCEKFN